MTKKFLSEYISDDETKKAEVFLSEVDAMPVYEVTAKSLTTDVTLKFLSEEEAENYAEDWVVVGKTL